MLLVYQNVLAYLLRNSFCFVTDFQLCQTVYALVATCGPSLLRPSSSGPEGLTVLTTLLRSASYGWNQNKTGTLIPDALRKDF